MIDPEVFLEREHSAESARLRVEFYLQGSQPQYWIQWWEPDTGRSLGWHQDETEAAYGPVHLQIEDVDGTIERHGVTHIHDEHPYRTFERLLSQISNVIEDVGWE